MKIIITPTGRTHLRSPVSNESIFPAKLSVSIFIKNANPVSVTAKISMAKTPIEKTNQYFLP